LRSAWPTAAHGFSGTGRVTAAVIVAAKATPEEATTGAGAGMPEAQLQLAGHDMDACQPGPPEWCGEPFNGQDRAPIVLQQAHSSAPLEAANTAHGASRFATKPTHRTTQAKCRRAVARKWLASHRA
jgi:hypothetical protein